MTTLSPKPPSAAAVVTALSASSRGHWAMSSFSTFSGSGTR